MKAWIVWGTILSALLIGEVIPTCAQRAAPAAGPPAGAQPAAPRVPQAAPPATPRRDPFRAIVVKRATDVAPVCTQPGKRSLLIGQLQVQGIARSVDGQWIAVVDNKTKRAYFLREKDEVCNGVVTRVTEGSLVLEEHITDSFGRTRNREVIKPLAGN